MKQAAIAVIIAGFLIASATLEASERRVERARGESPAKPKIRLTSGVRLVAGAEYGTPPPAPGLDGAVPIRGTPYEGPPLASAGAPMLSSGLLMPAAVPPAPTMAPSPPGAGPLPMAAGVALYPCVKYKDCRHSAPCGVKMVVAVRDPCAARHPCACSEGPKCVMVEICVPPCGCPKITTKHDGAKVRYDYGQFAVNITSRHGVVVVNYDD